MNALQVIKNLLDYGPAVFLSLIMFIIALLVRIKPGRALSAGLTLGVAFTGMSLVIGFMTSTIAPAGQAMVKNTGLTLTAIDIGWTPVAAIAWAWPFAALMFPLQIVINFVMFYFGWTRVLNVDMWNVWHKAFIGAAIMIMTGSPLIALVMCSIWIVLELKSGDLIKNQVQALTGIPGVTVTHPNMLEIIWMAPLNRLLESIPFIANLKTSPQELRNKLGFLAENHVLGFFLGILIGIAAGYGIKDTLILAVKAAACLTLFPMVAQLFMQALAPISEAASNYMRQKFPGREFIIGLDWPILAGNPTLWTACILDIPIILLCAIFIPGNITLPFGSILMTSLAMSATVITQGDLVRTWLMMALATPPTFLMASWFAPLITKMAVETAAFPIPKGATEVTWLAHNAQYLRWSMIEVGQVAIGKMWPGIIIVPVFIGAYYFYFKEMKRREAAALENIPGHDSGDAGSGDKNAQEAPSESAVA